MDPIEALNRIRHAIECYRAAESNADNDETDYGDGSPHATTMLEEADSIVEHIEALDGWMTRGGFLPSQWTLKRSACTAAAATWHGLPAELPRMSMFRPLTPSEVEGFRQWARANYKPCNPIDGIWHPVIQAECVLMNIERASP